MSKSQTRIKRTRLRCPQCRKFVMTRDLPNGYRCYACDLSFVITNPSSLRPDKRLYY